MNYNWFLSMDSAYILALILHTCRNKCSTILRLSPATSWDKHRSQQTTQRERSQEGNQATLYWKSPRCRCHPCRSLQAWWWRAATEDDGTFLSYVGWGSNTSTAQRCVQHPPLQKGIWSAFYWHGCCSTAWQSTWDWAYFQRVNAAFEVGEGPLIWSSLPDNCRRNAKSSMRTFS